MASLRAYQRKSNLTPAGSSTTEVSELGLAIKKRKERERGVRSLENEIRMGFKELRILKENETRQEWVHASILRIAADSRENAVEMVCISPAILNKDVDVFTRRNVLRGLIDRGLLHQIYQKGPKLHARLTANYLRLMRNDRDRMNKVIEKIDGLLKLDPSNGYKDRLPNLRFRVEKLTQPLKELESKFSF